MRIISTNNLKESMILGKPVFAENGQILLKRNVSLTDFYINNLKKKNIPCVYIEDSLSKDIIIDDVVDPAVKVHAVTNIKNVFDSVSPQNNKHGIVPQKSYTKMKDIIDGLINNVKENKGSLFNMVEVLSTDLSLYVHSVNVAILSILTGIGLGFNNSQLHTLAMGALMHDIGKVKVPIDVLNKSGKLTDEEFFQVKKHPVYGYEMIKEDEDIPLSVKSIILFHHERLDGTGYPIQLSAEKLNKQIRTVSVADMFDAMVSDRVYRKKMPIYKALEIITSQANQKIDYEIYREFIKSISIYAPGSGVILSDGAKGLITENNKIAPTRPKVKIIYDNNGYKPTEDKVVDLMKDLTLFIEDECEIIY